MKESVAFSLLSLLFCGSVFAAGQIDIAYSPYTITNPGSYIVVKDLTTAQNLDCIDIITPNVTLDLNGHSLYGSGSSAGSSSSSTGSGIYGTSGNSIEYNTLYNNDTGLLSTSSTNYLANNKAHLNTLNYSTSGSILGTGANANISY